MPSAAPPTVSVCVCCYNSQRFLDETLRSVLAQTWGDWELVVLDDGSTDGTAEVVRAVAAEVPKVNYRYQQNSGIGAARNSAVELATGEWIAFLDHDDVWLPEKLERQLALARRRPEAEVLYSDCYLMREDGARYATYFADNRYTPRRGRVLSPLLEEGCFLPLLTVMVRRAALVAAGGFDPRYAIVEDYDAWLRLAETAEFDYLEEPLAAYRIHPGGSINRMQDAFYLEHLDLFERWMGRRGVEVPDRARERAIVRWFWMGRAYADSLMGQGRVWEARRVSMRTAAWLARAPWVLRYGEVRRAVSQRLRHLVGARIR